MTSAAAAGAAPADPLAPQEAVREAEPPPGPDAAEGRARQLSGNITELKSELNRLRQDTYDHHVLSEQVSVAMRHGFEDAYNSEEYLTMLEQVFYMYFTDKRHETCGYARHRAESEDVGELVDWRMRERLKTVSAALIMCLNIGVDPPDVVKTNPCAKLECWIDPFSLPPSKALEAIGKNLQQQYETLSMRTRYKQYLDPSVEEMKKFCANQRRNAREERVLFHYNGHGVPKPTASGEIWVFNKDYTQYIPVSLYDLQAWLGAPCIYVYDCSAAGNMLLNFNKFASRRDAEAMAAVAAAAAAAAASGDDVEQRPVEPVARPALHSECIQLAACGPNDILPMKPDLPADLFTCCLTSPIEIAVRWFVLNNLLPSDLTLEMAMKIPGRLQDRRTPLGELNWVFTAITDTIAWTVLPRPLFKRLFRQDLMVAALFRNFLLADRIMRMHACTPMSYPALPPTNHHSMWDSWDLAVDNCLSQLPALLQAESGGPAYEYQHSNFFSEQLSAFEIWLSQGAVYKRTPDQLPIVLQVLLSQVHRLRALILLSKFLDLGAWAVSQALSIGIFPYVLKLLQSPANELKPVLVFIWARILAVDQSCQADLLKDNGFSYFLAILTTGASSLPAANVGEHQAMCAFILTMFTNDFKAGQMACLGPGLMAACVSHLNETDPLLRHWLIMCIGTQWKNFTEAKILGIRENATLWLCNLLQDPVPEVRAACVYALTTFLGTPDRKNEEFLQIEQFMAVSAMSLTTDGSSLVRKEFMVFISHFVKLYSNKMIVAAFEHTEEELTAIVGAGVRGGGPASAEKHQQYLSIKHRASNSTGTVFRMVLKALFVMAADPFPEVERMACWVLDDLFRDLWQSPLAPHMHSLHRELVTYVGADGGAQRSTDDTAATATAGAELFEARRPGRGSEEAGPGAFGSGASSSPVKKNAANGAASAEWHKSAAVGEHRAPQATPSSPARSDTGSQPGSWIAQASGFGSTLRRSVSLAASIKNLALYGNGFISGGEPSTGNSSNHTGTNSGAPSPAASGQPGAPLEPNRPPSDVTAAASGQHTSAPPLARPLPMPRGFCRDEVAPVLPLQSDFLSWSREYFLEPQMKPAEADEPGSLDYNQRLWRRTRNERIIFATQPRKSQAATGDWTRQLATLTTPAQPTRLLFHQFERHLVVADDWSGVSVWDWGSRQSLSHFSAGNPRRSRITEMKLINEDDMALLLVGSSDGVVKLYRNYDGAGPDGVEMVTSWRALTDMLPSSRSSGLVAEWQQGRGTLLIGGDVKVIRVWDAPREMCLTDVPARSGSCVTGLTSDQVAGNIFVAGFGDGAVRVYDRRIPPRDSMVKVWKEHRAWVSGVHMQRGGNRQLISASMAGDVRQWDIRMDRSLRAMVAHTGGLRSLAVHEHAPVFATGSVNQYVKVFNMDSPTAKPISTFRQSYGSVSFLHSASARGASTPAVTGLVFHPHHMILGASSIGDHNVSLVTCDEPRDWASLY